ncbi:hypothetical protein SGCOL_004003 [Colletotrichum sp. CLE4]
MERPSSEILESQAARPSIAKRISATAMGGLHLLTSDTELSQDRDHDEYISPTRSSVKGRSRSLSRSLSVASSRSSNSSIFFGRPNSLPSITESENDPHGTGFRDPFADQNSIERLSPSREAQNPFDDNSSGDEGTAIQELEPEPPYHVFTKKQKWVVIVIIGVAGLFSGLSSNIYFPALDTIARDLNVSSQMVSLTITSYLIIQGISPLIWGSISDALGRRPIYIASFAVYIIANIGLSFSPNFTVLLIFRGLQAAGSASTVSIGNGVIQDISPPAERGAFISFYQAIRNFSIAVGPVLGGLLANFLGFRSIFVFLLILSSIVTLVIVFWLPETMRSIAGNGSLRLGGIYKPIVWYLGKEPDYLEDPDEPIPRKKVTLMTFIEPLRLLIQKDILINLVFGGVVYTIWTMVTSSTTILFKELFGLSDLQTGLAFLPNGTEKLSGKNMPAEFPIERARLRRLPWIVLIFVASTGGYGLSLNFPSITSRSGWIAVPLVLQFFIAATSNAVFALNQTLVTDLCPGKGASATAINNLVRCGLGAIGVALVDNFVATTGPGAAFLGLALVTVAVGPLAVIHWYWGQTWRAARMREKSSNNEKA